MHTNPVKAGLTLGAFVGLVHIVWSVLVALNWGQGLLDFIFRVHMVHHIYTVGPFDVGTAVTLVVISSLVGYCMGYALATIWNRVHHR